MRRAARWEDVSDGREGGRRRGEERGGKERKGRRGGGGGEIKEEEEEEEDIDRQEDHSREEGGSFNLQSKQDTESIVSRHLINQSIRQLIVITSPPLALMDVIKLRRGYE